MMAGHKNKMLCKLCCLHATCMWIDYGPVFNCKEGRTIGLLSSTAVCGPPIIATSHLLWEQTIPLNRKNSNLVTTGSLPCVNHFHYGYLGAWSTLEPKTSMTKNALKPFKKNNNKNRLLWPQDILNRFYPTFKLVIIRKTLWILNIDCKLFGHFFPSCSLPSPLFPKVCLSFSTAVFWLNWLKPYSEEGRNALV